MESEDEARWNLYTERIATFLFENTGFHTFKFVAEVALGDPSQTFIVGSIASLHKDRFVVSGSDRVKLRAEAREREADRADVGVAAPSMTTQAAAAVQLYAGQLQPYTCSINHVGPARVVGTRFLHEITLADDDDDRRFVDDTPVTFRSQSGRRDGYIAGTSRSEPVIYAAFDYELPSEKPAWLEIHRRRLWMDLSESLALMRSTPQSANLLFQRSTARSIKLANGKSLALDLSNLPTPWSRLLWGPPGSGKTYCLGHLTAFLAQLRGAGRILVLAPSNVAVDAATDEIVKAFGDWQSVVRERRIVRFGYPRAEAILGRPELLGPASLEALSKEIHNKHIELKKLKEHRTAAVEIAAAADELKELEKKRKRAVTDHLISARVVTSTVAAVCQNGNPIIQSGEWDTVIVDECSMLNGALTLFLAGLAKKRFLLAGDPRQLAPIFEWHTPDPPEQIKRWLGKDPYEMIGFVSGEGIDKQVLLEDTRVAMLTSQRRCHPAIWDSVAHLYPGVRWNGSESELRRLVELHPEPGSAALVLDVSASGRRLGEETSQTDAGELAFMYETSCRKVGKSWENPSTARIAVGLALEIGASKANVSISIITPYRAQASLIRKWIDEELRADLRGSRSQSPRINIGTVHSFQGGQSDVVIFDLVDGSPRSGPGALLRGDMGMRLINVALTRARGKRIVIADTEWVREKCSRSSVRLLWDLLFDRAENDPLIEVLPPRGETTELGEFPAPESPIEQIFLDELIVRRSDLPKFRGQVNILNRQGRLVSRADFAFVDHKVAVYCDGAQFHLQEHRWQRDQRQRRELQSLGWAPFVFTGKEINRDVKPLVQELVNHFKAK
jgi:very-short-patch-repair endonuclease